MVQIDIEAITRVAREDGSPVRMPTSPFLRTDASVPQTAMVTQIVRGSAAKPTINFNNNGVSN